MKKIQIIFIFLIITAAVSLYAGSTVVIDGYEAEDIINAYKNDNLIRLHVSANSNSPRDQYLKRQVRKKVQRIAVDGSYSNVNEMVEDVEKNIGKFISEKGYNYDLDVNFGKYTFPDRTYGNITLPADEYLALNIILGRGEGSNWWCVLLPPLCTGDNIEDNGEKGNNDIELRFKIADFFTEEENNEEKTYSAFDRVMSYFTEG